MTCLLQCPPPDLDEFLIHAARDLAESVELEGVDVTPNERREATAHRAATELQQRARNNLDHQRLGVGEKQREKRTDNGRLEKKKARKANEKEEYSR